MTSAADRAMPGPDAPPRSKAMRRILDADWFRGERQPTFGEVVRALDERMRKHEFVFVESLPKCDFCPAEANYDGRMRGRSSWANMCHLHFELYGVGLGLGVGQALIVSTA